MPNTFQEIIDQMSPDGAYQVPNDSVATPQRLHALEATVRDLLSLLREKFDQDYRSER